MRRPRLFDPNDPTVGPTRRPMLLAIDRLTLELGRPPTWSEVREAIGKPESQHRPFARSLLKARELGMIAPDVLRLTPAARLLLRLPLVVYVAWPVPADHAPGELWELCMLNGIDYANALAAAVPGLVPVSPYFTAAHDQERAGPALAVRCDAVIVVRDELLLGRADVLAARRRGLPIAVLGDASQCPPNPWRDPYLVTNDPQAHTVS